MVSHAAVARETDTIRSVAAEAMRVRFTRLRLENWRNFRSVDVELGQRTFIVGANASGKSNLLDALRFLRDVAKPEGGGLQKAVADRGGVQRVRTLHARKSPRVAVDVEAEIDGTVWRYRVEFTGGASEAPRLTEERVWKAGEQVVARPEEADVSDPERLSQTSLEQVNANRAFRPLAEFLSGVRYMHLVPQLIRDPERYGRKDGGRDPYGGDFLEQLVRAEKRPTFKPRLRRMKDALRIAVPQLKELRLERDATGRPHVKGLYKHWRPNAGWQDESQFSDGTLRLLGLLWSVLDGDGPLLLEEPELSLHEAVVKHLAAMIFAATRRSRRQVLITTHSSALLSDRSIDARHVLLLEAAAEGTRVTQAATKPEVRAMLESDQTVGDAVLPLVQPGAPEQLLLFGG